MFKQKSKFLLSFLFIVFALTVTARAQDKKPEDVIVVDTDLVLLRASVTDGPGQIVSGLKKEDFKIYEDGVEQTVEFFSIEELPVSWGLVLDRSGSMMQMMRGVYQASLHVVSEGTDKDEMFIVTFNDKPEITSRFTDDRHKLENSTLGLRADGSTALYDAVAFALDEMKQGKFRKKVLVVVTDGEDNASRISFRKLVERVEEEEIIIYTVGMFEASGTMDFWRAGSGTNSNVRLELEKIAEVTGGAAHFPTDVEGCRRVMKEIALEVSRQYSIGYYPKNEKYDGKWRKISVKIEPGGNRNKYTARTRAGYYARKAKGGK
jgi:Ca-activated chloride channel family protein